MTKTTHEQTAIENTQNVGQEASMVTLNFTKRFTGGTLKGLVVSETMRFANESLAVEFVEFGRKGCRKPIGGSPWKIVDASIASAQRCSAIYSDQPCGGLMVETDYDDWPRCERCGTN